MLRFLPLVLEASQIAMKQPLTFFTIPANHCLAMFPLCSVPLIVLLVVGEVVGWSMLEHGYLGISQYLLYLINAHISFVKGWKARPYA